MDFVIKEYPARTDGKAGGMGRHLCSLRIGDTVRMKGPWKKMAYTPNKFSKIGMIAGGTGLTPMLQVVQEIVQNPEDNTKVTLLFANKTETDILLRTQLDEMSSRHPNLNVVYTLDTPPAAWKGQVGYVSAEMVEKHMPGADMVLVCGPGPMMNSVCGGKGPKGKQGEVSGVLKALGFNESTVYKF